MTTYYVDPAASGSNNGTSWTNAWTNAQSAFDTAVDSDIVYCRGTQTLSASIDVDTRSGAYNTSYIKFIGCNSSGTVDGTRFILDGNSGGYSILKPVSTAHHYWLENIEVKNTGSGTSYHGFHFSSSASYGWVMINCCANNCGGSGFRIENTNTCVFYRCVSYSNVDGFYKPASYCKLLFCCARDNSGSGFTEPTAAAGAHIGCIAHNNTTDGFKDYIPGTFLFNCVADGNGTNGIELSSTTNNGMTLILGSRFTNQSGSGDSGIKLWSSMSVIGFSYFEDNTDNINDHTGIYFNFIPLENGSGTSNLEDLSNTNEGYVDKTNHDFSTNYVDSGDPDLRRTAITVPWS